MGRWEVLRFKAKRGSEAQRLQGEGVVGKCVTAAAGSAEGMKQNLGWGQRSRNASFGSREHSEL